MIAVDFAKGNGLVPCVVQDVKTGQVLMLAYMNEESLKKTMATGLATYWSRSRQALWTKGETSGHYQHVRQILIDCDEDTLLIKVEQDGAACHTGKYSCFYRTIEGEEIL
jgi:phosphoribosyl-AMP cyclohydrolase